MNCCRTSQSRQPARCYKEVEVPSTFAGKHAPRRVQTCALSRRDYHRLIEEAAEQRSDESALLTALRAGDEKAFVWLIDRYHAGMLHLARSYVATTEAAEDVVQETWLAVINGLGRFEERSSLKTWIFRILVNRAKTRGERESRSRPFSSFDVRGDDPAVDPSRFLASGPDAGCWATPPTSDSLPEDGLLQAEAGARLLAAIDALPTAQRIVITLRDVQELSAAEVCDLLQLTDANQRVLLHRARSKVRSALESYLNDQAESP